MREQVFPGGEAMVPHPAVATEPRSAPAKTAELRRLNDAQLLGRFFEEHDDAAFSLLVERYGPLVFGVCRRILPDANDAEDAFQATFLVLVRKGASLRDPGRLASWLYGVAYRTARKARSRAALRTKSERQAGAMTSKLGSGESSLSKSMPTDSAARDLTYDELQAILDEEISQLPEKYALPLVLCYLEGKTNAQAAAQLGWPEGSISRRLSRARELLRSRLARRGLALSAALITAVFARPSSAAIPAELLAATTRACTLVAEGVELSDVVSPATARLVQDVIATMSATTKFAIPTLAVLAALLLVITGTVWQYGAPAHAASLLPFRRQAVMHGLMTTPTSSAAVGLQSPAAGESACCSAVTPVAATAPSACSTPAVP
jgi:RNA polymerase sigma factor (sigma-70 family)